MKQDDNSFVIRHKDHVVEQRGRVYIPQAPHDPSDTLIFSQLHIHAHDTSVVLGDGFFHQSTLFTFTAYTT